jgi:hypothetical protein
VSPHPPKDAPARAGAVLNRPRVAGRRPALPNGRAVVGGLLVAAAAVGTFAAWSGADDAPSTSYVVADRDLPVGALLEAHDVRLVALDAPSELADRAFASLGEVVGQRTVAPLADGELVQRSAVVVPEGDVEARQVSFAIDAADALAGTLEVGEAVDLLATYGATASESVTEVVAVGATVAGLPLDDGDPGGQVVVLLSLPDRTDVLAVTNAIRQGTLTVVRSLGEPLHPGDRYQPGRGRGTAEQ